MELLSGVLADPQLKQAAAALVAELCKEPAVLQAVTDLALKVIARDDIYQVQRQRQPVTHLTFFWRRFNFVAVAQATTELLVKSSTELLADETVGTASLQSHCYSFC